MNIINDLTFDSFEDDKSSQVFQIFPNVYNDNRGSFSEVIKDVGQWPYNDFPLWFTNLNWIKQINRSKSSSGVIRGMHAQYGIFCQGKLVEALTEPIFDVIIDARPNSSTFGTLNFFKLDPQLQNKLWVPPGFLHGFIVPLESKQEAIFNYYCSAVYNHEFEFGINPKTILPKSIEIFKTICNDSTFDELFKLFDNIDKCTYSEKDIQNLDYTIWMTKVQKDFIDYGKLWYKQ